ncbi:MAG: addiction module antidote protein, HigA family [Spirochaetaceae bacterium]|nr:addiction module antidote protein, HigA family [Spirochaetaceae bacterium]|tara:strand:+ start:45681 stop:45980 length:300 start_codon:yes stop_codon:yes gene_type:complete
MPKSIPTPTIGEVLKSEFLVPLELTPYRLAKDLGVSTSTILDLIHDRRRLSVEMALKLSKYLGMSEKFWLNLQADIDVRNKKQSMKKELDKIQPIARLA